MKERINIISINIFVNKKFLKINNKKTNLVSSDKEETTTVPRPSSFTSAIPYHIYIYMYVYI